MASRLDLGNAAAAVVVLCAGVLLGSPWGAPSPTVPGEPEASAARAPAAASVTPTEDGKLRDASGTWVPLRRYQRIGGGSLVADRLLLMLAEPARIAAFSSSAPTAHQSYRFAGKPSLPELTDIEGVLAQNLDLLIVNNLAQQPHIQRLREAGVQVFDLGSMHGIETLLPNIRAVGVLLGEPERALALERDFLLRRQQIAGHLPLERRQSAIYVGIHGDKMYGGTVGSSFHDILTTAGLRDAAADTFVGWPRYTNEQLLALDPQVIVTQQGMRQKLCNHPGLRRLRACAAPTAIVELDPALLLDPGLALVEAAAHVHAQVYEGSSRQP